MKRVLTIVILLAAIGGAVAVASRDDATPPAGPSIVAVDPHGAEIDSVRTLVVGRLQPSASRAGSRLHGRLVVGAMPNAATEGTVLSDEDCGADIRGISNCLNRIRLADGTKIAVRHPHDMRDVPCLAPGEPVHVVPA
jgi:hypothetical protein